MQAGEYGILLRFETGLSLAGVDSLQLLLRRPDGTTEELIDVDVADEALGTIEYRTVEGDLTIPGVYELQLIADFAADQQLRSPVHRFHVTESLSVLAPES
jgi:hypothetical protein